MPPRIAVTYAAALNFVGAFISIAVAATIAQDVVSAGAITPTVVFAGLVGAITWNLTTWYYGLPSSSSHALIGGVIGAAFVAAGPDAVLGDGVVGKVLVPAVIAPVLAFVVGAIGIVICYRVVGRQRPGPVALTARVQSMRQVLEEESAIRQLVKEYVSRNMSEGVDFGIIPGTEKQSLLKPGAQKLISLFRCKPLYKLVQEQEDFARGFFNYKFRVRLKSLDTGQVLAEGYGSANSREARTASARKRWPNSAHSRSTLARSDGSQACSAAFAARILWQRCLAVWRVGVAAIAACFSATVAAQGGGFVAIMARGSRVSG